MTATAVVFDGPGKPLRCESFPHPRLASGEALVRVRLCTLCGSDLHTVAGRRTEVTPSVLGHEVVGEIEELGPNGLTDIEGEPLRVGERIVWSVPVSCGSCYFCDHELPQKCESLFKYGHSGLIPERGPLGGIATHCHLMSGTAVVKVPQGLPDEVAAPATCATATAVAVVRAAGDLRDRTVLVLGAGLLGLSATALASSGGASSVVVADTDPQRLAAAKRFGATHAVQLSDAPLQLDELTRGRGADVVLEMSGSPDAVEASMDRVRIGGVVVLAGSVSPTAPVALRPDQVVRRCLHIHGVHNYRPRDLAEAIRFLAGPGSQFPFVDLIDRTFPLTDVEAAFRFAEDARPIRVGIAPGR